MNLDNKGKRVKIHSNTNCTSLNTERYLRCPWTSRSLFTPRIKAQSWFNILPRFVTNCTDSYRKTDPGWQRVPGVHMPNHLEWQRPRQRRHDTNRPVIPRPRQYFSAWLVIINPATFQSATTVQLTLITATLHHTWHCLSWMHVSPSGHTHTHTQVILLCTIWPQSFLLPAYIKVTYPWII